jgi:phosphatidylinositol kinase/protein kinase (PI-3  family)
MCDLALMTIFINHSLYVCYSSSSQHETEVLQIPLLKPLISPAIKERYAVLKYHMVLLGSSDTICNNLGKKALATSALSHQNGQSIC